MKNNWLVTAFECCGKPALFLSLIYARLGVLFLIGSLFLHGRMALVGAVLCATGIGILLMFVLLAFMLHAPRQNGIRTGGF